MATLDMDATLVESSKDKALYCYKNFKGYQHNLLKYCEQGENERFGRIGFAIGCDVVPEFKRAVYEVEESDWHPME